MNVHLPPFISAYRKNYNTQHVLLRLLEEWREHLDNNKTVGGILMDLSKGFDCVPHDLLLAKLAAYGIDDNLMLHIYSYLLKRKQCVCINNTLSGFNKVISSVPQVLSWDLFFSIVSLMIVTTSLKMLKYITLQMTTR